MDRDKGAVLDHIYFRTSVFLTSLFLKPIFFFFKFSFPFSLFIPSKNLEA